MQVISVGLIAIATMIPVAANAQSCVESSVVSPVPLLGNNGEIVRLADGSLWEVKFEYAYLYAYYPRVVICPTQGKLLIGGKSLNVQLISAQRGPRPLGTLKDQPKAAESWVVFEETNLAGSISGTVKQGRIFKTTSGNIYEVVGLTLQLVLELQPSVTVLKNGEQYKLIVQGFDEPLICKKLN